MPGSLTLSSPTSLRAWQRHALERLGDWRDGPFLISAAPGAGKTRPALELAKDLLSRGIVRRVAVLCPTTPLTRQWASAAAALGVQLQPDAQGPKPPRDFHGVAVTYARVAGDPKGWAAGVSADTLVVVDEAHHL
jgi:superfamily II DNA or RNA helicase